MKRRQRKKKWVILVLVMASIGLLSGQSSTSAFSSTKVTNFPISVCSQDSLNKARMGSCDAGGNCCRGIQETGCDISGGGFPQV